MKKPHLTLLFVLFCLFALKAQTSPQTQPNAQPSVQPTIQPGNTVATIVPSTTPPTSSPVGVSPNPGATTTLPPGAEGKKDQDCCNCDGKLEPIEWLLTLAPILLFLTIFFWMKRNLDKLDKYLVEKTPVTKTEMVRGNNDTESIPVETTTISTQPSTSRLIAFITGFTALIIAVSLSSFWIYTYITECKELAFNHLSTLLLTFGIGVAPYGFNKLSTAMK